MSKMITEWDFKLFYKSPKDPAIEADMVAIERACDQFEKKYRGKNFISSPKTLLKALQDIEVLSEKVKDGKPFLYFALMADVQTDNEYAQSMMTVYEQRISKAGNKLTFFDLAVGRIPRKDQQIFLKDPSLAPYRYQLECVFKAAKYNLTEGEEQLESLLAQTSYSMWVDGQEKILTSQLIDFKGKKIPISQAIAMVADLPKKDRDDLHKKIGAVQRSISSFAEAEINAVYNYKKVMDERRGFALPYSATLLSYEDDEKTVENLITTVTKYFTISKRFYKLHAKLLKQKKLTMADRGSKIGKVGKKFDFDTAVEVVRNGFDRIDPKYSKYLDTFLERGQIDVYPRKGKKGGAYCAAMGSNPTFVLLNHTEDIRAVETLAHEMGHAIHAEFSRTQPSRYQSYTTSTAEVASTFFEQSVSEQLETLVSEKEQVIILHSRLVAAMSTIFRQVAAFNFELELHNKIRTEGKVSKEVMAVLLTKHMKSYMGDAVEMTEDDGYTFVSWGHMRLFFYVYTYAFGQLVSTALYNNLKADHSYEKKIEQFLKAGRSMSPRDIFKSVGIDIADPAFFESGLKAIDADITKLEKLAKKQGLI